MRLFRLPAAVALFVTISALPAAAQTAPPVEQGTWSATPFLSFTFAARTHPDSCCTGSGLGLGAAVGYDLTEVLSVEGEAAYVFDLIGDSPNDWSALNVGANVLYHFPLANGMAPYGLFGIGLNRTHQLIDDTIQNTTEFGFNLGGGLKAPLTDVLVARGDLRFFKGNDIALDGWRIYGGLTWRIR